MSPAHDPRIRSPWGRAALAFGIFLSLAVVIEIAYLLAAVPGGMAVLLDPEAVVAVLEEPRILAGILTGQALAGVVAAIFMVRNVDRRPLADLGAMPGPGGFGALAWGLVLGVVTATAITLFISAAGRRHVQAVLFEGHAFLDYIFLPLVALCAAFMEELLFRGYLFVNLREVYGAGRTVMMTALAFAIPHSLNPGVSFLAWLNIVLIGIVLAQLRELTGAILMPLGLHLGWNLGLGMLFGVRVSGLNLPSVFRVSLEDLPEALGGGSFGPEASAGLTVVFAVMAVLLGRRLLPRGPESRTP